MNSNQRDAVASVRDFAEAMRLQYAKNLKLLAARPVPIADLTPFPTEKLTAAQSFIEGEGDIGSFIVLGHVENTKVQFLETEALCWLANDALAFDNGARRKEIEANPGLKNVVVLFGERTIARAIFLKALLSGFIRAFDDNLFERAAKNEQGLPVVAQAISAQSMAEFRADLEDAIPKMTFQREIATYARHCAFPMLPVVLTHKLKNHQVINGVALTSGLADQLRKHLEEKQKARS